MKRTLIAAVVLLMAAGAFAGPAYVPTDEERARWTHADMNNWRIVLEAYKTDYNQYPAAADIQELRKIAEPVYIRTAAVHDAWGNDFRYERDGDAYRFISAGADGKFGSADDLTVTPRKR